MLIKALTTSMILVATAATAGLQDSPVWPPPPDEASTIVLFILDADGDGQTDGGPVPGPVAEFPFLQQYDMFLDTRTRRPVTLTMNGVTLKVPSWKADSEGVVIAVFDRGEP